MRPGQLEVAQSPRGKRAVSKARHQAEREGRANGSRRSQEETRQCQHGLHARRPSHARGEAGSKRRSRATVATITDGASPRQTQDPPPRMPGGGHACNAAEIIVRDAIRPARAGLGPGISPAAKRPPTGAPHARGDRTPDSGSTRNEEGSAPRGRGCSRSDNNPGDGLGRSPADTGSTRNQALARAAVAGYPVAAGTNRRPRRSSQGTAGETAHAGGGGRRDARAGTGAAPARADAATAGGIGWGAMRAEERAESGADQVAAVR